jgi:DNA-binding IclR family transcriptional regulator
MVDRVLTLLSKVGEPMTTSEIARSIGSNPSQVANALKRLISSGEVSSIAVAGCYREYMINA